MITAVRVVRFKRFADETFDLAGDSVLLAGPNNSGKTTLLHAISSWNLALQRWRVERGDQGGKRRVSVVLDEFTALPLREMNLLWLNRHTAIRTPQQKQPKSAPIYIEVTVRLGERVTASLTMELLYANEKLVYVRPVKSPENSEPINELPEFAVGLNVVHVPAFSGIGTQEPRHALGIQNKLIGEGKPGEVVRNLLLDIWEQSEKKAANAPWSQLRDDISRLFACELEPPEFSDARPYIVCEYRPQRNPNDKSQRPPKLDIANAGSGFHQVLMLLAFFHAKPSSVLLLDEPDAHLHFILQREIFDHLRSVARDRNCKLVIATHAEVLLEGSEPDQIISFVGHPPKRLVKPEEKQRLKEALRRLTALDLLKADHAGAVLYVEDESDHKILREWASVLGHPAHEFLQSSYVYALQGKGNLDDAKRHFQCLRLAKPDFRGYCVLDRDLSSAAEIGGAPVGLQFAKWRRYEIENYLLIPDAIKRFLEVKEGGYPLSDFAVVDQTFAENFPPGIDYLKDIPAIADLKASDFLVDVLARTWRPLSKRDLFQLAKKMTPKEIHPEVIQVLDAIAAVPKSIPLAEAHKAPVDINGVDDSVDVDGAGNGSS